MMLNREFEYVIEGGYKTYYPVPYKALVIDKDRPYYKPVLFRFDRLDLCFVVQTLTAEEFFATRFDGKIYYDMDIPDRPKVLNTQYEYSFSDNWLDTVPTRFARITCRGR